MDNLWNALEKYAQYLDLTVYYCSKTEIAAVAGYENRSDYLRHASNFDGFCDKENGFLFVWNRCKNPKNFVLAHEIAHALLDENLDEYWKDKKRYELRANRVAAIVFEKTSRKLPEWFSFPLDDTDELAAQRVAEEMLQFYIA